MSLLELKAYGALQEVRRSLKVMSLSGKSKRNMEDFIKAITEILKEYDDEFN